MEREVLINRVINAVHFKDTKGIDENYTWQIAENVKGDYDLIIEINSPTMIGFIIIDIKTEEVQLVKIAGGSAYSLLYNFLLEIDNVNK
jgi:hypothetical protein